ncbi:hypothetical protein [Streptomyces sp. H39-S7]|uniref:hypothetical protein n=1 Tax=Streptomyces sp. H39-S7 TaxID=3004357 RepID=UPI0022AFBFE3|nr:hypothetical protein [Streptomyces sp. H39-S7]MCZ4119851.1 hypothetical protein [Streptomyces sp. H39-S7]
MTYAFTFEVPIDPATYARIREGLGPEKPQGLVAHLVHRTPNGLRYTDVWESQADWKRFAEERLHPVVDQVVTEALGFRPPEPVAERLDMIDAWIG